jgi:hypothetical protein
VANCRSGKKGESSVNANAVSADNSDISDLLPDQCSTQSNNSACLYSVTACEPTAVDVHDSYSTPSKPNSTPAYSYTTPSLSSTSPAYDSCDPTSVMEDGLTADYFYVSMISPETVSNCETIISNLDVNDNENQNNS